MGRRVLGIGVTLLLGACASEPVPRQSEAMERSARILAKLDQLEADLHEEGTKLTVYDELDQRHRQTAHVREIHRLAEAQERKQQEKVRHRRAVAVARVSRTPIN